MTKAMNLAPAATSHQHEEKGASFSVALTNASAQAESAKPAMARGAAEQDNHAQPLRLPQAHIAPKTAKPVAGSGQPLASKARIASSIKTQPPVPAGATRTNGRNAAAAKAEPTIVDATASLPRHVPVAAPPADKNMSAVAGESEIARKVSVDARNARGSALDAVNDGSKESAGASHVDAGHKQNGVAADQQDTQSTFATDAGGDAQGTPDADSLQDGGSAALTKKNNPATAQLAAMLEMPAAALVSGDAASADANSVLAVQSPVASQAAANAGPTASASTTSLPATKPAANAKTADAVAAKSAATSSAPGTQPAGKSTATASTSAASIDGNASGAAAQTSSTPGQHGQQNPQQGAHANANAAAATQVQAAASALTQSHAAAGSPRGGESSGAPRLDTRMAAENLPQPTMTAGINASKLIQTMSTSEMHVGMRSAEFGDISIRTAVTAQQMMTQISVDHSDLSREIASHLPQVQAKLAESFGLHASIEVHHSGMSFSGDGGQPQQQERGRPAPRMTFDSTPVQAEPDRLAMRATAAISSEYRLDIQA